MNNNTNKIKHLEFIESTIERMSKNSFQLKAWTMTLVTLISGFTAKEECKFIALGYFPIIVFWLLDSYYLQVERQYRLLFDHVTRKEDVDIEFSMDLSQLKSLTIADSKKICLWHCMFSKTEILFYGSIAICLTLAIIVIHVF